MKYVLRTGLTAAALLAACSGAQAQTLFGTFGFIQFGSYSANTPDLSTSTTTITLPNLSGTVNSVPNNYDATHVNSFASLANGNPVAGIYPLNQGSTVTLSTTTITTGGHLNLNFTDNNGDAFAFTGGPAGISAAPGSFTYHFDELGSITFLGKTQVADISGSFTQTGSGGAINGTFTFVSPPPPGVPEPGGVALVMGMGVSGAGFVVRRVRRHK